MVTQMGLYIKRDQLGNILKYKARLVCQGFRQRYGIDYLDVYAPVVKYASIRILLALSAFFGWLIHQMDVSTAFLNGIIRVKLFCSPPPGYKLPNGKILQLLKALYGTKQGARVWNIALDDFLVKELSFLKCPYEACIYIKRTFTSSKLKGTLILAIFVDDILVISKNILLVEWFKNKISSKFKMTDQGELEFFLGMQVQRHMDDRKLFLTQSRYHSDILKESASTPASLTLLQQMTKLCSLNK